MLAKTIKNSSCLLILSLLTVLLLSIAANPAYAQDTNNNITVKTFDNVEVTAHVKGDGVIVFDSAYKDGQLVENIAETSQSEDVVTALAAAAVNGWYEAQGDWFYFVNGKFAIGWKRIDGYWYYFTKQGKMHRGWLSDSGSWYYFRTATNSPTTGPNGSLVGGWAKIGGYWFKFDNSGVMSKGWYSEGSNWYYFRTGKNIPTTGPEGAMCTGWQKIGTNWHYFLTDGKMKTGWLSLGGYWYYMRGTDIGVSFNDRMYGAMLRGLYKIGADEYYFYDPDTDVKSVFIMCPEGAMMHDVYYVELLSPEGLIVWASIDSNGVVHRKAYNPKLTKELYGADESTESNNETLCTD